MERAPGRMIRVYSLVWMLLAGFVGSLTGQSLGFIHYNTNNSALPNDVVYSVFQDHKGFLWICTDDGLVRFDGLQMVSRDRGLKSRFTISTDESNDRLWLATWKGGVHYLSGDSLIHVPSSDHDLINANRILVYGHEVICWTFSRYKRYRFTGDSLILQKKGIQEHSGTEYGWRFIKHPEWGLLRYDSSGIYQMVSENKRVSSLSFERLFQGPGNVWYGLQKGRIYRLDKDWKNPTLYYQVPESLIAAADIYYFRILPGGNICLGTGSEHLKSQHFLIDPKSGEYDDLVRIVNTSAIISWVYTDREGGIWICTDGDGLYHVYNRRYNVLDERYLKGSQFITDLFYNPLEKALWIGTKRNLYRMSYSERGFSGKPEWVSGGFVGSIFMSNTGNTMVNFKEINVFRGLKFIDGKALTDYPYILDMALPHYQLYASNHEDLKLLDQNGHNILTAWPGAPPRAENKDYQEDQYGRLWVAVWNNLYLFTPGQGWKRVFPELTEYIKTITCVPGQGIWIGTQNSLIRIDENFRPFRFSEKEGLFNTHINCLHYQKGHGLWIGTQNGLHLLDSNGRIHLIRKRKGLLSDDILVLEELPGGILAVGGSGGVTFLQSDVALKGTAIPLLFTDEWQLNGNKLTLKPLRLELTGTDVLEISFSIPDFLYPEQAGVEYRLNPGDPWIFTRHRSIIITGLQGGEYQLEMRAMNSEGNYSSPVWVSLVVLGPWWLRWPVISLQILLLASGIYLILHRRMRRKHDRLRVKKELAELRLKALIAQLNPHFVSNALNSIQFYIVNREEKRATQYLADFARLTRLILESSRHRFILLGREIEILSLYLRLEKLRFEDRFEYDLEIEPELLREEVYIPSMLLQPFIENAINHGLLYLPTDKTGLLKIKGFRTDGTISFQISDNGIGRKRAAEIKRRHKQAHRSRGTEIVGEIVSAMNGLPGVYLNIETTDLYETNGDAAGTRVDIFLKLTNSLMEAQPKPKV